MREHLLAYESRTGETPQALLEAPRCPEGCEPLWHVFAELHACRGNSGLDVSRITFADIHAFQQVRGTRLALWELEAIRRVDGCWLKHRAAQRPSK